MSVRAEFHTQRLRHRGGAALEVAAAATAVALDVLIPALVILALAGASLLLRRDTVASLGFHRFPATLRTTGVVALLVAGWSVLLAGLVIPVLEG